MYKTQEEKRVEHMTVGAGIAAVAAVVGGVALLENHPASPPHQQKSSLDRHGDHHGLTGMPSEQHLKQFTHEHGIKMNGIGTAVEATKVSHHPVVVSKP